MELRIRRVRLRRSRVLEALLAAAILLAACATVPEKKPVPALVPFAYQGSPEDAHFAAALTDAVRKRLHVILLRPPLTAHGDAITGVLRTPPDALRLEVQLQRPGQSVPLWSRSFQRGREQLGILQDEVATEIGTALHTPAVPARDVTEAETNFTRALSSRSLKTRAEGFRSAIKLVPNYAEARSELARVLIQTGSLDEALQQAAKASELDPGNSGFRYHLGVAHLYKGQYQQAVDLFNTVDPAEDPLGWYYHDSWAHLELNHTTRVSYNLAEYGQRYGFDASGLISSMNAILQARFNNLPQAEMAIAQTVENGGDGGNFHEVAFNVGCAYARMGRKAAALEWLHRAGLAGLWCAPLLRTEPALRSLQSDPEFRRLVADAQMRSHL